MHTNFRTWTNISFHWWSFENNDFVAQNVKINTTKGGRLSMMVLTIISTTLDLSEKTFCCGNFEFFVSCKKTTVRATVGIWESRTDRKRRSTEKLEINEQERSMNIKAKSPPPPPLGVLFIGRGEVVVLLFPSVGLRFTFEVPRLLQLGPRPLQYALIPPIWNSFTHNGGP
jgi:hypothetical protein